MTPSKSETSLVHKAENCPLVSHRIACYECGYPGSEALFYDVADYLSIKSDLEEFPEVFGDDVHELLFDSPGG